MTDVSLATEFNIPSDERLKEEVEDLEDPLDAVSRLRPVTFFWKDTKKSEMGRQIGLIAQNVRDVFPEVVHELEDGSLTVGYGPLVAPLVGSVQQLAAKDVDLETRNRELEDQQRENVETIKALEQRVVELEAAIEDLVRQSGN